jgi:hypothetical protein
MRTALSLDPVIPLPQAIALAVLAVALAVWLYRRGTVADTGSRRTNAILMGVRCLVVAALALLFMNPVWTQADREMGKPPLLVVLDTSKSMAVRDVAGERRFDVARRSVMDESLLRGLRQRTAPVFYGMAETATRQDQSALLTTEPTGATTHIGESMAAALNGAGPAPSGAVLIISDGRNNGDVDPVQIAQQARARKFPVFTVCLGTQSQGKDIMLLNRRPQVNAAPAQEVSLMAEARSVGYQGKTTMAHLLKDGRPVAEKSIVLNDRRPAAVTFPVTEAKLGNYHYSIAVDPLPGEEVTTNNHCSLLLQVQQAHARVLVLEGRPTWDAKFLIQALHTDPNIEVDAIFKLADKKFFAVKGTEQPGAAAAPTPALKAPAPAAKNLEPSVKVPATAAELAKYNVVIIGKGYEEFFDDRTTQALKQFVADHAGNVIFLRGRAAARGSALEALEPVRWSEQEIRDFRLQVTDEGLQNPAFNFRAGADSRAVVQRLPKLISATRVEGEKALAVVLATAADVPGGGSRKEMAVLAYENYGQGKVVSLIGQGLWRWAFLPPDLKDYSGCYNDFWTQLVRWLVNRSDFLPGQDITLKTDHATYALGDTVNFLAYVRGAHRPEFPPVRITDPSGKTAETKLGKTQGGHADFIGSYKPREAGEYLASVARPGGDPLLIPFSVYPRSEEGVITAADPDLMRQIAAAGGGEALSTDQLAELPARLREAQSMQVTRHDTRSAWDKGWVLGAVLGFLTVEWLLRRRWGLA